MQHARRADVRMQVINAASIEEAQAEEVATAADVSTSPSVEAETDGNGSDGGSDAREAASAAAAEWGIASVIAESTGCVAFPMDLVRSLPWRDYVYGSAPQSSAQPLMEVMATLSCASRLRLLQILAGKLHLLHMMGRTMGTCNPEAVVVSAALDDVWLINGREFG